MSVESQWYQMMGLSKIFLRNFLIGCFLLLVTTITILWIDLRQITQDRAKDQAEYTAALHEADRRCQENIEAKNKEFNQFLATAWERMAKIDREIKNLKAK